MRVFRIGDESLDLTGLEEVLDDFKEHGYLSLVLVKAVVFKVISRNYYEELT